MTLGVWQTSLLLVASFGTLVCSPVHTPPGICSDVLSPNSVGTFSPAVDPQRRGPGDGHFQGGQGAGKATATRGRQAQPERDKSILLGDDNGSAPRMRKRRRSRTTLREQKLNPQSPSSVAGVGSVSDGGGCGNSSAFSSSTAQFPAGSFMSTLEILDRAAAWMEKRREYLMSLPTVETPENMWNGTEGWQVQGSKMMGDKCDACMMVGTSEGVSRLFIFFIFFLHAQKQTFSHDDQTLSQNKQDVISPSPRQMAKSHFKLTHPGQFKGPLPLHRLSRPFIWLLSIS